MGRKQHVYKTVSPNKSVWSAKPGAALVSAISSPPANYPYSCRGRLSDSDLAAITRLFINCADCVCAAKRSEYSFSLHRSSPARWIHATMNADGQNATDDNLDLLRSPPHAPVIYTGDYLYGNCLGLSAHKYLYDVLLMKIVSGFNY